MADDQEGRFDGLILSIAQQHSGINDVSLDTCTVTVLWVINCKRGVFSLILLGYVVAGDTLQFLEKENRFFHW